MISTICYIDMKEEKESELKLIRDADAQRDPPEKTIRNVAEFWLFEESRSKLFRPSTLLQY